ncbi:BURP domain-containing protein 13-like [Panicum miliaceum]|uniref:BURP domain-containing protein 13-like n=1 Tax=Panicum miliaceum TaxID=4540 RepID=A0A3L6SW52_PANMI|nr:BURP domain-containing protein 13-like [Panicum miliaceum]
MYVLVTPLAESPERVKKAGTGLFFHEELVRVGSTLTVSFSAAGVPAILPHDVAEKVPFGNLTARDVVTRFNIAPGSTMAAQVGDTLRACQARAGGGGEWHACAASLEDMVRAAMRTLGNAAAAAGRVWVAVSAVPRAGLPLQPYAVGAVAPLDGDHHVACHDEPYPYAVFRCHKIGLSMTRAYAVSLRGLRGGQEVTMAVICHLDTSDWNPAYPAFEMLHTKPGDSSVCHFMPYANLLFGVKAASTMASF